LPVGVILRSKGVKMTGLELPMWGVILILTVLFTLLALRRED